MVRFLIILIYILQVLGATVLTGLTWLSIQIIIGQVTGDDDKSTWKQQKNGQIIVCLAILAWIILIKWG